MISTLVSKETSQIIAGPAGKLEIMLSKPTTEERSAWGIVCHPHPLYGGTMHNKVVTTLVRTFQGMGLSTVRFNFRGVGLSEGKFDHGQGELEDLIAVVNWAQQEHLLKEIWLAGFSFGAYIVAKAATQLPVAKLVTVAPPVEDLHMESLPPITCPWVLVQGELDDVVSPKAVFEWAEKRNPKPIIIRFPTATHFFHGELTELRMKVQEALMTGQG
jgi:uncharacterized protein